MNDTDELVRGLLEQQTPLRTERRSDWANVLARASELTIEPVAKRDRPTRRRLVVAFALLATLVIVTATLAASGVYPFSDDPAPGGSGLGSLPLGGEQPGAPVGGAPAAKPEIEITGGSPAQRMLAREILDRMSETPITSVRFGPVPARYGNQPSTFSYLTLATNSPRRGRGEWDSRLFASAFADLSRKQELPTVFGYGSDYHSLALYSKHWDMTLASPPAATDAEAAALADQVTQAVTATAGASDVKIVSLNILRPERLAFALILQVSHPAAYMKHQLVDLLAQTRGRATLPDSPPIVFPDEGTGLAGTYIALQDADGTVVWKMETTTGTHNRGTGSYVRPDLQPCSPFQDSFIPNPLRPRPGAPGAPPAPTCPA